MAEIDVELPAPARAAEQAAPRGRMSWRAQLAVTHLAFAHNLQSTALAIFLVPAQVALIVGDRSKDSALAAVVIAGAFVGAVVQIIAGGLSDRVAFRLGRRRPFILCGMAVTTTGLYLMGTAAGLGALIAAFVVVQGGFAIGQSAYAALIPDRVPAAQRGGASGLIGLMALLGSIGAAIVAGALLRDINMASLARVYHIVIAAQVLFTLSTVLVLREQPLKNAPPFEIAPFLRDVGTSLRDVFRTYPDFVWVFVTRFLVVMGYTTVVTFLLYYVRDQLGRDKAASVVSLITEAVVLAAACSIFFGGYISDRVGRKPVVYASAGLMAVVSLTFIVIHTVPMAVAVAAVWGLGWGAFLGVDWALATDVLPRPADDQGANNFARYMGIWALASSLPTVISPAIGPLIELMNQHAARSGYALMFGLVALYFTLGAVLVRKVRVR